LGESPRNLWIAFRKIGLMTAILEKSLVVGATISPAAAMDAAGDLRPFKQS
jgi:hypothetical protein